MGALQVGVSLEDLLIDSDESILLHKLYGWTRSMGEDQGNLSVIKTFETFELVF